MPPAVRHPTIPPRLYRRPDGGHVGRTRRFAVVVDGDRFVERPECGTRFESVGSPWPP